MRALLFASILIVMVAVSAPSVLTRFIPPQQAAETVSTESVTATAEAAKPAPSGADSREVEVRAQRDGHFYVDAWINMRPVRMMVDTGATVVALRQSDAEAIGIRTNARDFQFPVETANGSTKAAETELDSVAVKDIEIGGVRALVLPDDQLSISLLGGSFLNRLARFEVADGTLIFRD